MVLGLYLCTGCRGWQRVQQSQKAAVDWLDGLIVPGELLLIVSYQ
jgi:hypothetical protein